MAFVSIGQKYGFVSIGDYLREQMAEERQELAEERKQIAEERLQITEERQQLEEKLEEQLDKERQKAEEEKLRTARALYEDGVPIETLVKRFNLTEEQILGK